MNRNECINHKRLYQECDVFFIYSTHELPYPLHNNRIGQIKSRSTFPYRQWITLNNGLSVMCSFNHCILGTTYGGIALSHLCIVPLILIFWDVDEKHFTYAGFDHFSILISFYQLCWIYVLHFVVWDLLGKELTHICLCVWVIMSQQNSGTTALLSGQDYDRGVRQAYGWRIS